MSFERIQYYYEAGLWSKPMVKMAVRKGVITREQYRDITGEDYRVLTHFQQIRVPGGLICWKCVKTGPYPGLP